jgi:hypothetical protein
MAIGRTSSRELGGRSTLPLFAKSQMPRRSGSFSMCERPRAAGPFGYPGYFSCIWEWGDISLHEFLDDPDDSPARVAVEANVTAALNVLHGLMLVHLDVAPNNILRVDATWKLADLDSCQRSGALARRHPINQRWVHPDRREEPVRVRARREFDWYGLDQILAELRELNPTPG